MDQTNVRETRAVENISLSIKEEKVAMAQMADSIKAIAKTQAEIYKTIAHDLQDISQNLCCIMKAIENEEEDEHGVNE